MYRDRVRGLSSAPPAHVWLLKLIPSCVKLCREGKSVAWVLDAKDVAKSNKSGVIFYQKDRARTYYIPY